MRTAQLTVEFRDPGEAAVETDENQTIAYGPDEVAVKIGSSIVAVDLEQFYMALDKDDPLRKELSLRVIALQAERAGD